MATTQEEPKPKAEEEKEDEEKKLTVYQRFENFLPSMLGDLERTWIRAIPFDAQRFIGMTLNLVRRRPEILQCEPMSILAALRTCAEYALYPDDLRGHAWIIPRYDKRWGRDLANFQLGYQGLLTLLRRAKRDGEPVVSTGKSVEAERVYKGDIFEYEKGLTPVLRFKPDLEAEDPEERELWQVYAIVFYADGSREFDRMTAKQLERFAETYVKAVQKGKSTPWTDSDFSRSWMEKKTVLRQVLKLSPSLDDPTIASAIALDERVDAGVSQQLADGLDNTQRAMAEKLLAAGEGVTITVEPTQEERPTTALDKMADREAKPVNVKPEHNAPEDKKEKPKEEAKPKPVEAKKTEPEPEDDADAAKKTAEAAMKAAKEADAKKEPPPPEDGDPGPAPEAAAPEPEKKPEPKGDDEGDEDWQAMMED